MLHRILRALESREAAKITLEMTHAMTLAHLHIKFLRVIVASGSRCHMSPRNLEVDCYQELLTLDYFYVLMDFYLCGT